MKKGLTTFDKFNENYPCGDCSAPCCRYFLIPYKTPTTWMDLDFVKYVLNFPKITVTVSKTGKWGILINDDCMHFDLKTQNCNVHDTPEQPKTCSYFNPYHCNYKANLERGDSLSIYILTHKNFKYWVQHIKFNQSGLIVNAPSFERAIKILKKIEEESFKK